MAITLSKLVALPSLVLSVGGIYFLSVDNGYYVYNNFGEKLDNYHIYKQVRSKDNNFALMKGINSKINEDARFTTTRKPKRKRSTDDTGAKAIKKIEDYSVKLMTKCSSGTGWFLDYIIPTDGKYPTKWFIATNAHVVSDYKFQSNKYNQVLPITYFQRGCTAIGETHTPLLIVKDLNNDYDKISYAKDAAFWNNPYLQNWFRISNEKSFVKAGKSGEDLSQTLQRNKLMYSVVKNPNLFYVPINFLGNKYRKGFSRILSRGKRNYYKDFAVLFVEFENENVAKAITNDFHGKYHNKTNDQLNLFKNELIKDYEGDELINSEEEYFVAGYPGNSYDSFQSFSNYSSIMNTSSQLSYLNPWATRKNILDSEIYIKNKYNQPLIGHADVSKIDRTVKGTTVTWAGQEHFDWGYNYLIDSMILGGGASGSLVTNIKGDVLGLYRMQDVEKKIGFIEPLRSDGLFMNGKILVPQYDLIKGVQGQNGSYKSQLDTYFPNENTLLRSLWNNK